MKVNTTCTKQYRCKRCGGRDLSLRGWRNKSGKFKWQVKCEDCGKTGTKASFGAAVLSSAKEASHE